MFLTDPVNIQPRVRPALRKAAEMVRKHPPVHFEQQTIDEIAALLEAPWGARIENQIRFAIVASFRVYNI